MRAATEAEAGSVASWAKVIPLKANVPSNRPALTNQQKVMYPETGFTKRRVVDYYTRIAPLILPHLIGRAVTLKRYPNGVEGKFFFEKRCNQYRPAWVKTVRVEHGEGPIDFCEIRDVATLQWAANLAAIELHVPLAKAAFPDRPTAVVFDLDPGEPAAIEDCAVIALRLKSLLDQLKLKSVVKTSGSKGLHVLVPLSDDDVSFEDTKRFASAIARTLEKDDPDHVVASMSRAVRAGKVFIDWSQNDRNKTTACIFSLRARSEPTISWPIEWQALTATRSVKAIRADHRLPIAKAAAISAVLLENQKLSMKLRGMSLP